MRTGKKGFRRITAMVCALALCASLIPTAVFAEPETTAAPMETPNVTNSEESAEDDEIKIDDLVEPSQEPTGGESDEEKDANTELESDATPAPSVSPAPSATPVPSENPASGEETTEATEPESVPDEQLTETPSMDSFSAQNTVSANVETLNNEEVTVVEAVDGTAENFYADPDKMIWLSVSGGTETAGQGTYKQNVTFTINIDGNQAAVVEVQGLARNFAKLSVNAANYDFTAKTSQALTYCTWEEFQNCYLLSNHNFVGDNHYSYDVTIDLTTPTLKDNDAIRIENEEKGSYYGTFFWAKGTATTSDYERPLEVYVNGDLTYTTTVKTPKVLTAGSASYWFEANLADYTSNVTLDPSGSLDTVTQKTLKVYLTTKCACGNDNCQCSGGCECKPGCSCPQCKPEQGENEIVTPYGTISYDPNAGVKRSLQVEIYVNGQKEYATDKPLTVSSGALNGFGFTANETKGYYFESQAMTVNSYDILVRDNADDDWEYVSKQEGEDASSWDTLTNNIKLIYDKDYMVRIYLYTFDSYMTVVVQPESDAKEYVQGYTISYQARDPETGEEKTYTYPATSLSVGQPQIVPYGRKITLTADCLPNYEATSWYTHRSATDLVLIGERGNTGTDITPQRAYGNTVWFTAYGTSDHQVQVYIDGVKEIVPPTDDEMQQLLGNAAVKVDCTTKDEHSDATYALKAGSYDKAEQLGGNSVDNYTYTITVNPDAYLADYNAIYAGHSNATPPSQQIVFEYVAGEWTVKTEAPVAFSVSCDDDDDEPSVPTDDDTIKELLDQKVTVKCTNDANPHEAMSQPYGALDGGYEVGELKGNANDGYWVDVTIQCDTYVTQYNTDTKSKHVLESNESKTKTITLCYDMAAAAWEKPKQTVINVTCKVDKPGSPDEETVQELLKNKILVKCVNTEAAHGEKTYDLENGTYQIGTVQGDEKIGYTVDVTITNSDYLAKFNTDLKAKHELVSEKESTVTLRYVADSKTWKVDTNLPVEILVTCKVDKPDSPDDETVQDLLKNKILVKCVNTEAAHGEKTYDLEDGSYQIGTVQGDEKTGYTVDVTIANSDYLAKFNTDLKAKHELVSEKESTVTLRYVADSKTWKVDTNLPVEILVTCKDVEDADIVVTPADMTIYRGGDVTEETNSHVTIVDKDGKPMGNDGSLPEIGYSLKLSQELNDRLHNALKLKPDAVLDLSKYITLTGKTATGETLTWKLEPYGEGSSVSSTTKDGYFIYKITPMGDSDGAKLHVSFMDSDDNYVSTDAFYIEDGNTLDQTLRMKIYGDRVDASTLYATIKYDDGTSETVSVQGAEEPATLKVRYAKQDADVNKSFETVAQASEEEDGNDQTKLSNAYMIRGGVNDFMINNSNVQVSANNVSLLVDDIAKTAGTNFEETLEKGAVDAVKQAHPEVDTSKLQTAAKYMDLVDATNGNAWVTTKENVTVYLPFPEGTDASTKFYVAHFDGLDREGSVSEITAEVNKATAKLMGDVKADKYGISFTTNSFSPYVLVWDTTKNQPTPPSGGDNDNNNNNNNTNSNTNSNTQTTTVSVNNSAAASAPTATASAIPQTGDTMPVGLLGGVAVVAAAAFAALFVLRKRKHND